jgi:hypothetical protein
MVTTKRKVTAGLVATGLGASMGLVPLAASAQPQGPDDGWRDGRSSEVKLFARMHVADRYDGHGFALYKLEFGNREHGPGDANGAPGTMRFDDGSRFDNGGRGHHVKKEFSLRLWDLRRLDGKRLTVKIDGDFVGKMTVSHHGTASLYRHHDVPWAHSGDKVKVRTHSGKLVSWGTLYKVHHRDYDRGMVR